MKKYIILCFFTLLFLPLGIRAQNAANYIFSTNATGSLTTIGTWTTIIGPGQNNTTFNDGFGNVPASAIITIPFDVWFMGERFTSFSINTNGVLRLGDVPIVSQGNTYNIPGNARLSPFGASSGTGVLDEGDWQTGQVRYRIDGVAPNRVLIVQCNDMRISYNSGTPDASFEMRIQETSRPTVSVASGQITFVYGRMTKGTTGSITGGNIGIGYIDGIGNDFLSVDISNHTASTIATSNIYPSGVIIQLNSTIQGNRRTYIFNPVQVSGDERDITASCLSNTSVALSWTDNATNEVGIVLYRSTDGVNYTFDRQLPANTASTIITGLTPSTNYYYQVYAVTEGKLSALTPTSTVVVTTLPASVTNVYSITNGNWNTLSTWSTNTVPTTVEDVIIGCIVPHTVQVNANGVANNLTIETGSVLNFNIGQTITAEADVINKGTINLNSGTLIVKGNLINTAGATVNIQNGTLIVEGNLQNAAIATVNGDTGLFRLGGNFINQGAYNPVMSTMRFDGTTQQLINHTGTSTYNFLNTVTFNTSQVLPLSVPSVGTGGGAVNLNGGTGVTLTDLNNYGANSIRIVDFNIPAGVYTGINNLFVDIEHTWNSDLEIYLVTPDNTVYSVAADMGGSGNNYNNVTFTMNPPATTTAPVTNTTITGSFFPMEDWTGYAGIYAGTWSLYIIDDTGGEDGQLNSATLTLNQPSILPIIGGLQFYNVQMENTGVGVRTQNTDIVVNRSATWTNGVFRADNNHIIIFPDNATSTVGSNTSHADMRVRKIGNDAFDFPVGNAGWGAPIGISAPTNVTDHFTANYVKQITPYNPFLKEPTIHHVGQCEYWILDRTSGISNVVVTLSYNDVRSCTVGPPAGLKVVRWGTDPTATVTPATPIWRDHFNGGLITLPYTGVLSSGTVDNFSPFTLGALTDDNILPLAFLSFEVKPFENDAILEWTTTGELNHDYFEIQRSFTGKNFEGIGNLQSPTARDDIKSTYAFIDKSVGIENRDAYYRLKQINKDGTFSYSNIEKVSWSMKSSENETTFMAYPNPFTDILTLEFSSERQEDLEIALMDMAGRTIKIISQSYKKGNQKVEFSDLQNLARGSYLIQLRSNTTTKAFKVVKM